MQDEILELHAFYASSRAPQPAARVVAAMAARTEKWVSSTSSGHGNSSALAVVSTMGQIKERGMKYGAGLEVSSSADRVREAPCSLHLCVAAGRPQAIMQSAPVCHPRPLR